VDLPTQIEQRLRRLGVRSDDVRERFVLGGGPGGQKINRTASTVVLRHGPSGLVVRCQANRSREQNRLTAWTRLCDKLEAQQRTIREAHQQAVQKQKRRTRPKSPTQKRRMVADKRHRSQIKARRGRVSDDS
jgi:protein subunit release factor B